MVDLRVPTASAVQAKINFQISGHPIITAMVVAFVGAVILLFLLRMLGFGRGRGEH